MYWTCIPVVYVATSVYGVCMHKELTPKYAYIGAGDRWHIMRYTAGRAESIACLSSEEKARDMTNDCNALAHHEVVEVTRYV